MRNQTVLTAFVVMFLGVGVSLLCRRPATAGTEASGPAAHSLEASGITLHVSAEEAPPRVLTVRDSLQPPPLAAPPRLRNEMRSTSPRDEATSPDALAGQVIPHPQSTALKPTPRLHSSANSLPDTPQMPSHYRGLSNEFARSPTQLAPLPRPAEMRDEADQAAVEERFHRTRDGDTLQRLARRYLGDEALAAAIFAVNRDVLDDLQVLPLKTVIRIPSREEAEQILRPAVEQAPPQTRLSPVR